MPFHCSLKKEKRLRKVYGPDLGMAGIPICESAGLLWGLERPRRCSDEELCFLFVIDSLFKSASLIRIFKCRRNGQDRNRGHLHRPASEYTLEVLNGFKAAVDKINAKGGFSAKNRIHY